MYEMNETDYDIKYVENGSCVTKTFFRMFLGLLATALTAFWAFKTNAFLYMNYGLLGIIEIAVVLVFSLMFKKLSPTMVTILFFAYAFINGLTMSVIFVAFEMGTIFYAFGATALLFGILAFYGYKTKKDMSKLGTILSAALITGLIITLINLLIGSTLIDIVIDWAMILIFAGLTAYDMNKLKELESSVEGDNSEKLYVYCAMQLYLDFINMFLRILSVMNRRRD